MAASMEATMGRPASLRKISWYEPADTTAVTTMLPSAAAHSGKPPNNCTATAA